MRIRAPEVSNGLQGGLNEWGNLEAGFRAS